MVRHGWDWNSSTTTITTLWLLSHGWKNFWLMSLRITPSLSVYRPNQPFHISSTHPISHHKYNEWLYMVQIGVSALKCLLQPIFRLGVGTNPSSTKRDLLTVMRACCKKGPLLSGKFVRHRLRLRSRHPKFGRRFGRRAHYFMIICSNF